MPCISDRQGLVDAAAAVGMDVYASPSPLYVVGQRESWAICCLPLRDDCTEPVRQTAIQGRNAMSIALEVL